MAMTKIERRQRIRYRIRKVVNGTPERPRMSVFRSNKQIYVQVIDDTKGVTLVSYRPALRTSLSQRQPRARPLLRLQLWSESSSQNVRQRKVSPPSLSTAEVISITEELKVWQTQPARAVLNSKRLWQISM